LAGNGFPPRHLAARLMEAASAAPGDPAGKIEKSRLKQ
jgi:hypothetical protein